MQDSFTGVFYVGFHWTVAVLVGALFIRVIERDRCISLKEAALLSSMAVSLAFVGISVASTVGHSLNPFGINEYSAERMRAKYCEAEK